MRSWYLCRRDSRASADLLQNPCHIQENQTHRGKEWNAGLYGDEALFSNGAGLHAISFWNHVARGSFLYIPNPFRLSKQSRVSNMDGVDFTFLYRMQSIISANPSKACSWAQFSWYDADIFTNQFWQLQIASPLNCMPVDNNTGCNMGDIFVKESHR